MAVSIPRQTQISMLEWAENFAATIGASPSQYNLTLAQAATISAVTVAFRTAYDLAGVVDGVAVNPAGYTQPNRAALYNASVTCIDTLSAFAVQIQADNAVSDTRKIQAGVVPRNFTRPPRVLPVVAPVLSFIPSPPGTTTVRAHNDVGGLARPPEANGVEFQQRDGLFDSGAGTFTFSSWYDPAQPIKANTTTVTNPLITLAQALEFRGRYYGSRNQVGPWSAIIQKGNS